jgi:hypothetical protein
MMEVTDGAAPTNTVIPVFPNHPSTQDYKGINPPLVFFLHPFHHLMPPFSKPALPLPGNVFTKVEWA